MRSIKKLSYLFIAIIMTILILPFNVKAATNDQIGIYFDGTNYLIYPNNGNTGTCEWALGKDNITEPVAYSGCSDDNAVPANKVIMVSAADSLDPNKSYLWMNGNAIKIDYSKAIKAVDVTFIENELMKTIGVKHYENYLAINENVPNASYEFIVEVAKDGDLYTLVERALALDPNMTTALGKNPFSAILTMNNFITKYNQLLPNSSDPKWRTDLRDGNIIDEPDFEEYLEEGENELYMIVWLKRIVNGTPTYDMQIMLCVRDEGTETVIRTRETLERLPYTGMSYFINGLLGANLVILPIIYYKKRKLEKITNE